MRRTLAAAIVLPALLAVAHPVAAQGKDDEKTCTGLNHAEADARIEAC